MAVITLAHGGGGAIMQKLIADELLGGLGDVAVGELQDAAMVPLSQVAREAGARERGPGGEDAVVPPLALTTDSFVVRPLVFPGGDIGKLAVCGTINDLAMRGARPLYLTLGLILEEGLELSLLQQVMASVREAAEEVGVRIVTGDTKVVERGKGDGLFINTTGLGVPMRAPTPSLDRAQPGDKLIINGPIGDHGIAVLAAREQLGFEGAVESDCACLWPLVEGMLEAGEGAVHVLHDPTRGGVAAALNEMAQQSQVGIEVWEAQITVRPAVQGACDLLGLDPLHIANEGKLLALVAPDRAEAVLAAMRDHPLGHQSTIIGEVRPGQPGRVVMQTPIGTRRIVDVPSGELLPRIC